MRSRPLAAIPGRPWASQEITRFGIPETMISDNGTQFTDKKFGEFLSGLGVKQKFSSVEHPLSNSQFYRTIPQSSTGKTPFWLTNGVDAVIPVEIGEPSPRLLLGGGEEAVEKDLIDETREMTHLSEMALKQRIALRYNRKVLGRSFEKGDLVLRCNDIRLSTPAEGKLVANWESP
ncbi:uncharacterized protein [Arachis hypogaea]|uniref:uncharacterized protein n=1 Tax=Arachis hypogaea TaxID=3818 RepID=UPI000DED0FFA|nr:uncharacterized protein LOC112743362 [Arachis hypogaea]